MKKIILSMGIAFSGIAMAQTTGHEGRVGITTTTPMATLDIEANGASKLNGILIPRVTKADAEAMGQNTGGLATDALKESTMVYISDATAGATTTYTSKVDAKGFYYFNGTEWVKVGSGAATSSTSTFLGPVTGNIREVAVPITADFLLATDFAIIATSGGSKTIELPSAANHTNRIISINNQSGGDIVFNGSNPPLNASKLAPGYGHLLMSNGTRWYVIGGLY